MKIINLLDDFNLGGVTKGLSVFDEPEIRAVASVSTVAIQPDLLRAESFDADLLLTHFPPNWRRLPYIMSLKRRNSHARIVHVEHSYGEYWFHRNVPNPARFKTMLSLALGQFDAVVNVSDAQRIWMTQLTSLPTDMFRTIYPYSANPAVDALAPPTFAKDRPLTIGTYGRLHECKGFDRLIEAFKTIGPDQGLELVIGGDGPQEAELKSMADGAPHIRFAGFVDEIAGFLEACDVIAVPSRNETFGQVALEARRAARPLLVSDIDGLPEQVSDCGLIVDCSNQHVLQSALMLFKILPLKHMSRMARASAQGAREESIDGWLSLIQGRGEERSDLRYQLVS